MGVGETCSVIWRSLCRSMGSLHPFDKCIKFFARFSEGKCPVYIVGTESNVLINCATHSNQTIVHKVQFRTGTEFLWRYCYVLFHVANPFAL